MISKKSSWIFGMLFFSFTVSAQTISQKFTHYGKQDGLNQSSVNFIFQDSDDYLWIANFGGINKFDGYNFSSYTHQFNDVSSIPDNSVWTILERKDSTLWFGTKAGLSKYNRKQDNFINYYVRNNNKTSGTLAVKALFEDSKGQFYVGSEGEGLFMFLDDKKTFSQINLIPDKAKISAISEDVFGNLWVGTENLGLFKISSDRSNVTSFTRTNAFDSLVIWSLYSDEKGNTWIGTDMDGLVLYDSGTNTFVSYKNQKGIYGYNSGDKIKTIQKGHQDVIWIGSATKGLSYYSYQDDRFYNYTKDPYNNNSLFDNDVSSIFTGTNNVLYVGFYTKGFDKVTKTPFKTIKNNPEDKNTLSNNNVYCMYLDTQEFLWFGTYGGGLNRYDPVKGNFIHYQNDQNDFTTISHNWVRIIFEDSNNTLWIGTWGGGLNKFDRNTGKFKRYLPESNNSNSLNHNIITALFEDKNKELWIGTYGGGINIYRPDTDDFKSIVHKKKDLNSLSDDHITSFYQDKNDLIWICTYGGGLNSFDKNTGKFERFLPDQEKTNSLNSYKTLHIFDEPGHDFFWITTLGGGINKFFPKEKKFLNYTEKDGLSNNSTMGMLKDSKGTYWISSNNGLSHFNPVDDTFVNYTMHDGLGSDDYNLEAYAKTKKGLLYFGGKNGVTYFNPKDVQSVSAFPEIRYTNIKIEDSLYRFVPEKIKIPYKSRATFEYAAINPNKTDNIKYSYQLIGQDEEWRFMDNKRYLEFTNLSPGNYELRVKSTNSSGVWSEQYASISLYVPTPWFMTWYFRGCIIFMIFLSGYSYYRIKLNRARKQNKLLENKVLIRTKTIEEKSVALEIEKNKTEKAYTQLKKLEGFKNELTSILAHDLKNPLVTILSYSSENSSDSNLESINKSGRRMLNLIENMLEVEKFENTEVKLLKNRYNLKNLAIEATNQVKILALEKRIEITNSINEAYNANMDKNIIERVFVNLLSNAIKFSKTDSKVEIFAKEEDHPSDMITITVKDYGTGIPENKLSIIFDKFSQLEAKNSGSTRSTGLGLTFCKMAIEAHKGKIKVVSEIDKGTAFSFSIPKLQNNIAVEDGGEEIDNEYKNSLNDLTFETKDIDLLNSFTEKINTLTIYQMGEWLDVFDNLETLETANIKKWKSSMMEALANFDENAFSYLKKMVVNKSI